MGYTHYWTQKRNFTRAEWDEVTTDMRDLLTYAEHSLGIPLADGMGEHGTHPVFKADAIQFNGVGDDAHETFVLSRTRTRGWPGGTLGWAFCKTAEKPYDKIVVACLCYLATVTETHSVSSDGNGGDFTEGLAVARAALPARANILDIPLPIMQEDRWVGPWISGQGARYTVQFCMDGYGYAFEKKSKQWYRFENHAKLARFLDEHKEASFRHSKQLFAGRTGNWGYGNEEPNIWHASGSFDEARHTRIKLAQAKVLATLFPVDQAHAFPPPAFVRPNDMARTEDAPKFYYSLDDLLKSLEPA